MNVRKRHYGMFSIMVIGLLTASCAMLQKVDQEALKETVSLKVDTLNLLDKAVQDYARYEPEVEKLMPEIEKAYEFANMVLEKELSAQQWKKLQRDENLLGGFFEKWKKQGKLSPAYVKQTQQRVGAVFDKIIAIEKTL